MGNNNQFDAVRVEQKAREKQQELEDLVGDFFLKGNAANAIEAFGAFVPEYAKHNQEDMALHLQHTFKTIALLVRLEQINTKLQSYRGEQLDNEVFV